MIHSHLRETEALGGSPRDVRVQLYGGDVQDVKMCVKEHGEKTTTLPHDQHLQNSNTAWDAQRDQGETNHTTLTFPFDLSPRHARMSGTSKERPDTMHT